MAWLRGSRLRWVIAGAAVLVAVVVTAMVAWPHAQRYTGAAPPAQFYEKVQLEPALDREYNHVLGVAHNAGNNLGTLARPVRANVAPALAEASARRTDCCPRRDQRAHEGGMTRRHTGWC